MWEKVSNVIDAGVIDMGVIIKSLPGSGLFGL